VKTAIHNEHKNTTCTLQKLQTCVITYNSVVLT